MVPIEFVRSVALALPGAAASPHFDKESFRFKKKIFATLDSARRRLVVKLSPVDQSAFCAFDLLVIAPANGFWGAQGWTVVDLRRVKKTTVRDLLTTAHRTVSQKKSRNL